MSVDKTKDDLDDDFRPLLFYKDDNGNLQPIWDLVILSPDEANTTDQGDKQ